jgi:hypothetical protein
MPKRFPINLYDASNSLESYELFLKRTAYKVFAYYEKGDPDRINKLPPPIKDFWQQENCLYGRVNEAYTPVRCGPEYLNDAEDGVSAVNFVVQAYYQMKKEFNLLLIKAKNNPPAPPLNIFRATKGYQDLKPSFTRLMKSLESGFFYQALSNPGLASSITSFEDFLPLYLQFIKTQAQIVPITFSSFLAGPIGSVMNSGLALEIGEFDNSSDDEKIKDFITHPWFTVYKQLASKYGFFIDKNAPWRLVANLSSPAMQKFIGMYTAGSVGPTKYFSIYTSAPYLGDIIRLKNSALKVYIGIRTTRPQIKKPILSNGCSKYRTIRRPAATSADVEKFPFSYWLKFYIHLKNIETGMLFPPTRLDHFFNNSKNLANSVDNRTALGYINRKFDRVPSQVGSLNHDRYKIFFKNIPPANRPFSDFEEYYKKVLSVATYNKF